MTALVPWTMFSTPEGGRDAVREGPFVSLGLRWPAMSHPIAGRAIIDTGADRSCIDHAWVDRESRTLGCPCPLSRAHPGSYMFWRDTPEVNLGGMWLDPTHMPIEACRPAGEPTGRYAREVWRNAREMPGPEPIILGRDLLVALNLLLVVDSGLRRFCVLAEASSEALGVRQLLRD